MALHMSTANIKPLNWLYSYCLHNLGGWIQVVFLCRWDPNIRMTPEEALQHDWIKEGLVNRKARDSNRSQQKASHRPSPAVSDTDHPKPTDPYKVPAQVPGKGEGPHTGAAV